MHIGGVLTDNERGSGREDKQKAGEGGRKTKAGCSRQRCSTARGQWRIAEDQRGGE